MGSVTIAEASKAANSSPEVSRQLTAWSACTVLFACPLWAFIVPSAIMSRVLDGGIFLSVAAGIERGLPMYSGVWDNKDPLFYLAMAGVGAINDAGPFVMDWLWIPIASLGGWLIARSLMSGDRALLVGVVLVPLVLVGPFYQPGAAITPGSAVALLTLGLVMARCGIAGGVVLGLLAFTKLIIFPVVLLCVVGLLVSPKFRRVSIRALVAALVTTAGFLVSLGAAGWLGPYWSALGRNSAYASDVLVYFGFTASPLGHLTKLAGEWRTEQWIATGIMIATAFGLLALWAWWPGWRTPERGVETSWLLIVVVGTTGSLSLSYVWSHHGQSVYLPTILAVIGLAALVPDRWHYLAWLALTVALTWGASGLGNPSSVVDKFQLAGEHFGAKWAEIAEVPTDARLLNSVPISEFKYARLGTNDDRGFLTAVREGANLGCPEFHLYDFSPPAAFDRVFECLETVDVVVKTDNFDAFAQGGRAASAKPILDYLAWGFDCLRVNDRQLCTRKPQ